MARGLGCRDRNAKSEAIGYPRRLRLRCALMIDFIPAPASLPPGQRVYAIGDIHGCLDRLQALHDLIAEDLTERPTDEPALIHLGDYVDRGPDSAGVVARWLPAPPLPDVPTINLMGNHEQMMLAAIATGESDATELWLANGGADSLLSWDVPRSAQPKDGRPTCPCRTCSSCATSRCAIAPAATCSSMPASAPASRSIARAATTCCGSANRSCRPRTRSARHRARPHAETGANCPHEPYRHRHRRRMGGVLTCAVLEEDRLGFITV